MESLIEYFNANYAWEENYLEMPIDIDDVHCLMECSYLVVKYGNLFVFYQTMRITIMCEPFFSCKIS